MLISLNLIYMHIPIRYQYLNYFKKKFFIFINLKRVLKVLFVFNNFETLRLLQIIKPHEIVLMKSIYLNILRYFNKGLLFFVRLKSSSLSRSNNFLILSFIYILTSVYFIPYHDLS